MLKTLLGTSAVTSLVAAGALWALPAAADQLAIQSIKVSPAQPVVRATGSVSVVIDVVARGVRGGDGVTIQVEPGIRRPGSRPAISPRPSGSAPVSGSPPASPSSSVLSAPSASPAAASPAPASSGSASRSLVLPVTSGAPLLTGAPVASEAPVVPVASVASPSPAPAAAPSPSPVGADGAEMPWGTSSDPYMAPPMTPHGGRSGAPKVEWETWRFMPETKLSRWYPSGPWTITATATNPSGRQVTAYTTFMLRRATGVQGVTITKTRSGGLRVSGTLLRLDPLGRVDYRPYAGQRVEIRFRPQGSAEWKTVKTAVTGSDGWFAKKVRSQGKGTWRVDYAGNAHYAGDVSVLRRVNR